MNSLNIKPAEKNAQKIMEEIRAAMAHIRYGEVVITIHDCKVVQIEKREKKRY
jgi:hypothetical protein